MNEEEFRSKTVKEAVSSSENYNPCVPNIFALMETSRLRDTFAMAALVGRLIRVPDCRTTGQDYARIAYELADAMLEARK